MPQPWPDPDKLHAVLDKLARRKLPMFRAFPEFCIEDLRQIAHKGVLDAWPKYDPNRGAAWSTFCYQVGWFSISNAYRQRQKQGVTEGNVALDPDNADFQSSGEPTGSLLRAIDRWVEAKGDISPSFVEKLYRRANAAFPPCPTPEHGGRPSYRPACYVCAVAVMRRLRLSSRGMVEYLRSQPAMRRAIGFNYSNIPSYVWFHRAGFVTENLGSRAAG